jgi:REase_MTES_1575
MRMIRAEDNFRSAIEWPEDRSDFQRIGETDFRRSYSPQFQEVVAAAARQAAVAPLCESPIEIRLGAMLVLVFETAFTNANLRFAVCSQADQVNYGGRYLLLIPQYKWKRWRYDFALRYSIDPKPLVFIECDGKEFHSSAEQRATDKKKDDEAARAGVAMCRFTGSQIFNDPAGCARDVVRCL